MRVSLCADYKDPSQNDLSTDSGNILFGGIDTQKFIGELALLPLVSDNSFGGPSSEITSFNVRLDGFDLRTPDGETPVDLADLNSFAILDSGSTISLLPDDQVRAIWEEFGVIAFRDVLAPFIDCAYAGRAGEGYVFDFRFDGKTIEVPLDEMVIDAYDDVQDDILSDSTLRAYFGDWEGVCMFGIGSTGDFGFNTDQFTLLGATFLRSAYVVYDLENEQLGLAQANLDTEDEDIVEITAGGDLPDVTGVDRQSPTGIPTPSPSSSSSSSTTTPSPTTSSGGDDDDDASSTRTTDSPSETETDSGTGSDDGDDNEGASTRMSPPIVTLSGLMGLIGVAFIVL